MKNKFKDQELKDQKKENIYSYIKERFIKFIAKVGFKTKLEEVTNTGNNIPGQSKKRR